MLTIAAGIVLGLLLLPLVPIIAALLLAAVVIGGLGLIIAYNPYLLLAIEAAVCLASALVYYVTNFLIERHAKLHPPSPPERDRWDVGY